jgi:UDP-glucuronate 4-epimerase
MQRPDLAIRKFATLICEQRPIPFFGDGTSSRDYTFIDDIVEGIDAALRYSDSTFEVINLGNNRPVSLRALVGSLERSLKRKATFDYRPAQPGDVTHTWADTRKAKYLLNWQPKVEFDEGVDRFTAWFLGENETSNKDNHT